MREPCYVCTLPIADGSPVYRLRDDDGLEFVVHEACMDKMKKVAAPIYEYRRDGWPFCPQCGEDELASQESPFTSASVHGARIRVPRPTDRMRCLVCSWSGAVPARQEDPCATA